MPGQSAVQGMEPGLRQAARTVVESFIENYTIEVRAGIFKAAMGARNRGGRGLSYRPARLHRLAEFIPWNRFRGPIHV